MPFKRFKPRRATRKRFAGRRGRPGKTNVRSQITKYFYGGKKQGVTHETSWTQGVIGVTVQNGLTANVAGSTFTTCSYINDLENLSVNGQSLQCPVYSGLVCVSNTTNNQLNVAVGAIQFALSDLPFFLDRYVYFYDTFRIDKVKMYFCLEQNGNFISLPAATDSLPMLYVAPDYDDNLNPTTISSVSLRTGAKCFDFAASSRKRFSYTIRPKVESAVINSSGSTIIGNTLGPQPFVDCANASTIPFRGLKWVLLYKNPGGTGALGGQDFRIRMYAKYWVSLKDRRVPGS